jgi:hypothetical protein
MKTMSLTKNIGILLLLVAPVHAADACKILFDAADKVIVTPAHLYVTMQASAIEKGKTTNSEMIYSGGSGGAIYVQAGGKWTRSRMSAGDMLKQEAENRADPSKKVACQYVRDEPVNGEAAGVYKGHFDEEGTKSDVTVWISKSKGLPLKQDYDMDVGGPGGKSHMSTRYEYTNVRPPAGVQ